MVEITQEDATDLVQFTLRHSVHGVRVLMVRKDDDSIILLSSCEQCLVANETPVKEVITNG